MRVSRQTGWTFADISDVIDAHILGINVQDDSEGLVVLS